MSAKTGLETSLAGLLSDRASMPGIRAAVEAVCHGHASRPYVRLPWRTSWFRQLQIVFDKFHCPAARASAVRWTTL